MDTTDKPVVEQLNHRRSKDTPERRRAYSFAKQTLALVNTYRHTHKKDIRAWNKSLDYSSSDENAMIHEIVRNNCVLYICIRDLLQQDIFTIEGLANELNTTTEHVMSMILMRQRDVSLKTALSILNLHRTMI